MPENDNAPATPGSIGPSPDPHGQAALLLVESLIHGLCEQATLSTDQAIEITERAANAQLDRAKAADGASAPLWRSYMLLSEILASLQIDGGQPPPPRLVT